MFVVTVIFEVHEENASDFRLAVGEQARNSLELEPECHVFDVCEDDAGRIYLYEKYTSAEAFKLHLQSDHFKNFDGLVTPWLKNKAVETWTEIKG